MQVPNVHDPPEKEVQSDLVSKYDDSSNRYAVLVEDDAPSSGLQPSNAELEEQFVMEDPGDYLESLGHTRINGIRRSKRISKRMIEARTLHVYNMSVTKALKKCAHLSKPAILAELKQMLDKGV